MHYIENNGFTNFSLQLSRPNPQVCGEKLHFMSLKEKEMEFGNILYESFLTQYCKTLYTVVANSHLVFTLGFNH